MPIKTNQVQRVKTSEVQRVGGNINCPIHGTHGLLSNNLCWYCVQSGMPAPVQQPLKKQVIGQKRRIV